MASLLCPHMWRNPILSTLIRPWTLHTVTEHHTYLRKLTVNGIKQLGSWTNINGHSLTRPIRFKSTVSVIHNFKPTCSTHWLFKRTGGQLFKYTTPAKFQHLGVKTTVAAGFQRSPENTPDRHSPAFPSDNGMALYLTAENGYLSWMRNTYIMSVVLVGALNLDSPYSIPVICSVIILTAVSNMLIGSLGFILNLNSIKRRGHISSRKCLVIQSAVLLHIVCWFLAMMLLAAVSVVEVEIVDEGEWKATSRRQFQNDDD